MVCVTGSADGQGRQQPDTHITTYDYYLRPTTSVEIFPKSNGLTNTRTTETSYVADTGIKAFGEVSNTKVSAIINGNTVPGGTTQVSTYTTASGLLSTKTVGASSTSYLYDKWGRKTSFTNSPEPGVIDISTWSYVPTGSVGAGQTSTVATPKTSYTYGYGADGETRSLPTSLAVAGITEPYTASYGEAGRLVTQKAPGGVSQNLTYDTAGRVVSMSYQAKVSSGGTTATVTWMDFNRTYDPLDRVLTETTPGMQPANGSDTVYQYSYSDQNRLVNVNQIDNNVCVNRAYTFDNTGNRTQKITSILNATNNDCGTPVASETPATQNLTYNNYSQLTNSGYVYDVFGRATTIPSIDTANAAGNVTFGYSIEDRITSQNQSGLQTDYSYDANGHRYQDKVNGLTQVTRHYSDESDNPTWVTSGPTNAITQTDVYTPSLGASLNITSTTKTTTVAYLNLANLHGDTITSLQIPTTGYVSAPNNLNVFDEYGVNQPLDPTELPNGSTYTDPRNLFINNYGSLGQAQRETTDTGIQFMGARGYNPITGQFLSPDPIRGGNETPYNYPNDPINKNDITGTAEDWQTTAISFGIGLLAAGLIMAICASTAGVGCLVSGLIINGIGGLTAGAIEADNMGYKGQKRTNYMLETAGIWAASWRLGGVSATLIGRGIKSNMPILRFYASKPKWIRGLAKFTAKIGPGATFKFGLKSAQNYAYSLGDF